VLLDISIFAASSALRSTTPFPSNRPVGHVGTVRALHYIRFVGDYHSIMRLLFDSYCSGVATVCPAIRHGTYAKLRPVSKKRPPISQSLPFAKAAPSSSLLTAD